MVLVETYKDILVNAMLKEIEFNERINTNTERSLAAFVFQMNILTCSLETRYQNMRKKEMVSAILVIALILFCFTTCRKRDVPTDKIITPIPQTTLMVDQEDTNRITTEKPEITEEANNVDTKKNLKEPKSPTYIPEGLLTLLESSVIEGHDINSFSTIARHKELSSDEINRFINDKVVGEYVNMVKENTGTVLQVDADNDGVQDLFFKIKNGGSMGNSSRYLFKGNEDGTYIMTDSSSIEVYEELAFIDFRGKNYLLQVTFDYHNKINNGFEIICYIDGKVHERIFLSKDAVTYDESINLMDKTLEDIANSCLRVGQEQYAYHVRFDNYMVQGSAERLLDEKETKDYPQEDLYAMDPYEYYGADIDNDGKEEVYYKDIFFTSSARMVTHLQYEICNTKGKDIIEKCRKKIKGCPLMFWVERSKQGNIVCILSLDDLLNYTIYGYDIKKSKVKEVFRITFVGNGKINREIYTTGINLEDEKW